MSPKRTQSFGIPCSNWHNEVLKFKLTQWILWIGNSFISSIVHLDFFIDLLSMEWNVCRIGHQSHEHWWFRGWFIGMDLHIPDSHVHRMPMIGVHYVINLINGDSNSQCKRKQWRVTWFWIGLTDANWIWCMTCGRNFEEFVTSWLMNSIHHTHTWILRVLVWKKT